MDWAEINILCIILVAGSRILVSGNTDVEEDKDNEHNLEDTLDEAENEKTHIHDILDKVVPNETEDEKIEIKDDLNDNGELMYDEDGKILAEVEDYSYENEEDHSDGELIYDEDEKILAEVEDYSFENEDDNSDIKDDTTGEDILDKAVYADEDIIYDEDGNIKDDDEFYNYEEDDEFLDVSEVENIGSVLTRAGKSLKETGVGEVKHDDGNVLDDEDDYSYETEDDFTEICPDDYVVIESECFQMSSKSYDWDKASATCEENSGHLASLKHPMALREYIIKHYPKTSFWVGGRHIRNPDGWQWISGNRFSAHFPWATHNRVPKKNKGECIVLRYFPKQGEPEYVDNKCARKIRFICERQKVKLDLEKKLNISEHTDQILDTVISSEEKIDHEKKTDIATPTPQILEKPTSGEDTIDDLKLMLSG